MYLNTVEIAQFRKDPTILSFKLRTDQSLAVILEKINKATKLSLIQFSLYSFIFILQKASHNYDVAHKIILHPTLCL